MKEKKQTVKMRQILAAADGEVKCRKAGMGWGVVYFGEYYAVNKRDFRDWRNWLQYG